MANITHSGGSFVLVGSLGLEVPQGAVPQGTTVTITATALAQTPPVAEGYQVHGVWLVQGNRSVELSAAASFNHPLVDELPTDDKLRFYSRNGNLLAPLPCQWNPRPESPLGDEDVDGGTGYLPPENPSAPTFQSYLCLVEIP